MARVRLTKIDEPAAVAARIKEARAAKGLTLRELAFPGCTPGYLSRIENGDRVPSLQLMQEIAERLGVSADYLARGRATPDPTPNDVLAEAEVALRLGDHEIAEARFGELVRDQQVPAPIRGRALAGLAELALGRGETDEGIAMLEEAEPLVASDAGSTYTIAESLGSAYTRTRQYDLAILNFKKAYEAAKDEADPVNQTRFGVLLANALIDSGNTASSFELLADLQANRNMLADPLTQARVFWTQSRLHITDNRPELAMDYARRALKLIESTEHTAYAARLHVLLAYLEIERGNGAEALNLLDTAEQGQRRSISPVDAARLTLERARALALVGRADEAVTAAVDAASTLDGSAGGDAARAYTALGATFGDLGRDDDALRMFDIAIAKLANLPNAHLARALRGKAEVLERRGDKDGALAALKRAVEAQTDAGAPLDA